MSASHREALAQMMYGVQERKSLMVVTGEVGCGKTTMIFTLLSHLDEEAKVSIIFDTHVDSKSLYRYIFADFGIDKKPDDRAEATILLREFLSRRLTAGEKTMLILDEAHNLSKDIFNEVVFLTNLETMQNKLLQIVLVGQPELNNVLNSHEFRQLRQRVNLRTEIQSLDFENTRNYIYHRLREAGRSDPETLLDEETIQLVFLYSKGVPRMINTLCDNSLLMAYARQKPKIDPALIKQTYKDLMEIPDARPAAAIPDVAEAPAPSEPPAFDAEGNRVLSEDVLDDTQSETEHIRIVRRVVRTPDGREVDKQIRQVRKIRPGERAAAPEAGEAKRRHARAPLLPLPDDIPYVRVTPSAEEDLLPAFKHDHPAAVRQFHLLWDRIDNMTDTQDLRTIVITSSLPREGKSVVSINLAATIAQAPDARVLLVDADLHQPRTHDYLGMEMPDRGLANILQGQANLSECLIRYELDRLYYLAAGRVEGMPTELLVSNAMQRLLEELKGMFHFIIFDSPPVVPIADTVGFAGLVDGVVLVAKSRETSRKVVSQALDDLSEKRILGVVLNGLDYRLAGGRYKYGYG
ncbi:MAG: polysaccharide biosynthesis tyrosine autokinase, partial [Deltaproteobacteria bacterium]|nr:polysaccharide biosynthesis tyrosine autokinase [Deltaproteobacteria bacterium]